MAIAIVQDFQIRFKKFLLEVTERREKELIKDKIFWENMYKQEVEHKEKQELDRDEDKD